MKSSKPTTQQITENGDTAGFTVFKPLGKAVLRNENHEIISYSHDELIKSLYWIWDAFDRAMMGMFLVYGTAESVINHMLLDGEGVHVGVRNAEYYSGSKPILIAFTGEPEKKEGFDIFKCPLSEAPVFVHYFDEAECIKSTDSVQYQNEYFKLPNPYSKFIELWPLK